MGFKEVLRWADTSRQNARMTQSISRDELPERKRSLADLVKKATQPIPVHTTNGELALRPLSLSTLDTLNEFLPKGIEKHAADMERLGALTVQSHISKLGEDGIARAFTEAQVLKLPEEDLATIAKKFAGINNFELSGRAGALSSLGSGVFDEVEKYRKQTESLASQFTGSLSGISESVKQSLAGTLTGLESMRRYLDENSAVAEMARRVTENTDYLERARLNEERILNTPLVQMPSLEDGPMGRAARAGEDAAAQLREVAGLTGQMVSHMSTLNELMITEVFPKWFESLKGDAAATREAAKQAESNLFWAKWALVASVLATLGTAAWQIWLSGEYEKENDKQQATTARLMQEQVEQSKRLISLQEAQAAGMAEFLSRQRGEGTAQVGAETTPAQAQKPVQR